MAFKLAEAFVELKAKGHAEVIKETEKVKEKTKELGPQSDQAAKQVEGAASRIEKAFGKSQQAVKNVGAEVATTARKIETEIAKVEQTAGKGVANTLANSASKAIGGRLGGLISGGLGGGLAGLAGVGAYMALEWGAGKIGSWLNAPDEMADGLARGRSFAEGQREDNGARFLSADAARQSALINREIAGIRGSSLQGGLGQSRLSALQDEADRLRGDSRLGSGERYAAVMREITREEEAQLDSELRKTAELEKQAQLHRQAVSAALEATGAGSAMLMASGRTREEIALMRQGLTPEEIARVQASKEVAEVFGAPAATADAADKLAEKARQQSEALADQATGVSKLRREYEALKAALDKVMASGVPVDPGLQAKVDAAGMAVNRADEIAAQAQEVAKAKREREQAERKAEQQRAKDDADERRRIGRELDRMVRPDRNTTSFGITDIPGFARKLQEDVFAKEEQKKREEDERRHNEAQEKREAVVNAVNAVNETCKKIGIGGIF